MSQSFGEYAYLKNLNYDEITINPDACIDRLVKGFGMSYTDAVGEFVHIVRALEIEREAKAGNCLHIFFEGDGFSNWLRESAPPFASEQFAVINNILSEHVTVMFHFKGGSSQVYLCGKVDTITDAVTGKIEKGVFCSLGRNNRTYCFCPNNTRADSEINAVQDTISGALAYMMAFPDMVYEGVPKGITSPNHFRTGLKKTVMVSPDIYKSETGAKTPHFRSGHFRLLSSEFFKNKKGSVVFVHGCFVHGKAETVIGIE